MKADTSAIEVGMKFRSSTAGYVTGIRFYKATANKGTHTRPSVVADRHARWGRSPSRGESASGWQQANFARRFRSGANTTYVISYYRAAGPLFG